MNEFAPGEIAGDSFVIAVFDADARFGSEAFEIGDEYLSLYDLGTRKLLGTLRTENKDKGSTGARFLKNGTELAVSRKHGEVELRSLPDLQLLGSLPGTGTSGYNPTIPTANENQLIFIGNDNKLSLWNLAERNSVKLLFEYPKGINPGVISKDGSTLVCPLKGNSIQLFDLDKLEIGKVFGQSFPECDTVKFHPSQSHLLISTHREGVVLLWDLRDLSVKCRYIGHTNITKADFLNQGEFLVTGSQDNTMRIWQLETGQELYRFEGENAQTSKVAVVGEGRWIVSGGGKYLTKSGWMMHWHNDLNLWEIPSIESLRKKVIPGWKQPD